MNRAASEMYSRIGISSQYFKRVIKNMFQGLKGKIATVNEELAIFSVDMETVKRE